MKTRLKRRKITTLPKNSSLATANQIRTLIERSPMSMLVVKDNRLIEGRYKLTLNELKLAAMLITPVNRESEGIGYHTYRLRIKDFIDLLPGQASNMYTDIKKMFKHLMGEVIEIRKPKREGKREGWNIFPFLVDADYDGGNPYIDYQFSPKIEFLITQRKKNFTSFDVRIPLGFKHKHSFRLYELLKQFKTLEVRTIKLEELKRYLNIMGDYERYQHLKERVLNPAQNDLKTSKWCDISFTYEPKRIGNQIVAIKFRIYKRKVSKPDKIQSPDPNAETTEAAEKLLIQHGWVMKKGVLSIKEKVHCRRCAVKWAGFIKENKVDFGIGEGRPHKSIHYVFAAIEEYRGEKKPHSRYLISDLTWRRWVPDYLTEREMLRDYYEEDRDDVPTMDELLDDEEEEKPMRAERRAHRQEKEGIYDFSD